MHTMNLTNIYKQDHPLSLMFTIGLHVLDRISRFLTLYMLFKENKILQVMIRS